MPHRCPLYPEVLRVALNSLPALRSFPPDPLHAGPRQELSQEHSLGALLSFGPQEGGASAGVGLAAPWFCGLLRVGTGLGGRKLPN